MTIPEPAEIVSKIDAMVAPAPEPENAVLTDETRLVRWTGPMFALFSLILLPWTIYIAGSLPAEQVSTNYDAAWAGFDVLLTLTLASTAYFALRRSRYLATAATATATLLVVDAWFDVLTTPGVQRIEAILLAAFVELPLAARTIMAGVRIATVTTIGTATIAAAIGGGGLGVFIFRGIASVDTVQILAGAVPAALLALLSDGGLGWIEKRLSAA